MNLEKKLVPEGFQNVVNPQEVENLPSIDRNQSRQSRNYLNWQSTNFLNYGLGSSNFFLGELGELAEIFTGPFKKQNAKNFFGVKDSSDDETPEKSKKIKEALDQIKNDKKSIDKYLNVNNKMHEAYEQEAERHKQNYQSHKDHYMNMKNLANYRIRTEGKGILPKLTDAIKSSFRGQFDWDDVKGLGEGLANDAKKGTYQTLKAYHLGKFWLNGRRENKRIRGYERKMQPLEQNIKYFNKEKSKIEKAQNNVEKTAAVYADYLARNGVGPNVAFV